MRCETARTILELNLPRLGEADWRDLDAVENHLAGCPECHAWWSHRAEEDNRLAQAFRSVAVPNDLANKLVSRMPNRRPGGKSRGVLVGLAAAVLILAGGLGVVAWNRNPAPPLDPDAVSRLLAIRSEVDGPTSHERMDQLVESFQRLGVEVRLPDSLNYNQVISFGVTELQGRKVPQVLFQTEDGGNRSLVRLLVLDSKKFDLSQYSVEQNAGTNRQMELVPDSENPRFYFLLSTQELGKAPRF